MEFKKLHLENFKIHKNLDIEFYNKNIIIGENGTGKSTIFHAILFSLFGSTVKDAIGANNLSSFIRYRSNKSIVELYFKEKDREYLVRREIFSNEVRSTIYEIDNGNYIILANGEKNVNKKIMEILNVKRPSKIVDIIYVKQGDLGKYMKLSGKQELTNLIEKYFNIDEYHAIIKIISGVLRDIDKEKGYLEKNILEYSKDIEKFREMFGNKDTDKLLEDSKRYNELKKKKENLEKLYYELQAIYSNIDFKLLSQENYYINKRKEIKDIVDKLNEALSNLRAEKKFIKYKEYSEQYLNKSIEELEEILKILEKEIQNINYEDIIRKENEYKDIINKIDEYLKNKDVEIEYNKINSEYEKILKDIASLEYSISEIKRIEGIILELGNVCPVCKRPLSEDEHKSIIEEFRKNKENYTKKYTELLELKREIEYKKNNIEKIYRKVIYIKDELIRKNINLDNIENEKNKIMNEYNEVRDKIEKYNNYNLILNTLNYIKSKKIDESIRNLEENYNKYKKELDDIEKIINNIENMKKLFERYNNRLKEAGYSTIDDIRRDIENLEKEIKPLENIREDLIKLYKEKLEKYERLKIKLNNLRDGEKNLNILYNSLVKFVEKLRENIASMLSEYFKQYFFKLYRYDDITDVGLELNYGRGKSEYIYHFYVIKRIDGVDIKKYLNEAGLSGGQIKILDLAFRLALMKALNIKFNVIMLDEPTESLDENVRINLAELLDSMTDFQLILCTHDDLFKEKIDGNIIEFRREAIKIS